MKIKLRKVMEAQGYQVTMGRGKRSIGLYKHPTQALYKIVAFNQERTGTKETTIILSAEAIRALHAIIIKSKCRAASAALISPAIYPPRTETGTVRKEWALIGTKDI